MGGPRKIKDEPSFHYYVLQLKNWELHKGVKNIFAWRSWLLRYCLQINEKLNTQEKLTHIKIAKEKNKPWKTRNGIAKLLGSAVFLRGEAT